MHVSHLTFLLSLLVGAIAGAVSGSHFGVTWVVAGRVIGLAVGFASFVSIAFPYVCILIKMEPSDPEIARSWSPPRWWGLLFFPVMLCIILLAYLGSSWAVRSLASIIAA